jgi:hypothetical protein
VFFEGNSGVWTPLQYMPDACWMPIDAAGGLGSLVLSGWVGSWGGDPDMGCVATCEGAFRCSIHMARPMHRVHAYMPGMCEIVEVGSSSMALPFRGECWRAIRVSNNKH